MTDKKLYDQASHVAAEEGQVLVDGPDGVAVALTPDAALETAERLTAQAAQAAGQRHFEENKGKQAERYSDSKKP
ncbi:hypothetical protein WG907_10160 [Sphingobium sp. AN558]|uniref:hypothetical protein n=1 Tax=Sphingobium sp. AN558 TaxID=3133442 RepID=UPI0030C20DFC